MPVGVPWAEVLADAGAALSGTVFCGGGDSGVDVVASRREDGWSDLKRDQE